MLGSESNTNRYFNSAAWLGIIKAYKITVLQAHLDFENILVFKLSKCFPWQGDFTRTGERKLAGVMKDGVNSANRYYLNRFKDAYRQAVIGKQRKSLF